MSDDATSSFEDTIHRSGETTLWKGRIGFNFVSSPVTVVALFGLAGYTFWAIWGTYTLVEFCPPANSVSKCGAVYTFIPLLALLAAMSQCFDMLERRALSSGKAHGAVLLTDRRLIRVSDWPWRRVRSFDYTRSTPRSGFGGVITFAFRAGVILSKEDKEEVLRLMRRKQCPTA